MSLSKNSSARFPSRLSTVAVAVISINAACISANSFAESTTNLSTLVVTGEKMDKDIKDTTTAVTIINGEDVAKGDAKTVNDVVAKAPNVIDAAFGTVNIRGINGSGATTGYYATVSGSRQRVNTSVDGVADAFTGYNFSGSGVWDVEQIEVLRGPQSTTQGENSIGGAISVKTNDPTFDPEAAVRLGLETYKNGNVMKNLAVMTSGPVTEDLAYRIAADGTDGKGYLSYDGETSDVPVDPEESSNLNLRGKLLWKATDDLTVKVTANHRKADGSYLNWANWKNGTGNEDETFTLNKADSDNTRIQDSKVNNLSTEINYVLSNDLTSVTTLSSNSQTNRFDQYPKEETYTFQDKTKTLESRLLFTPNDSALNGFVGIMIADRENTLDNINTQGKTEETRMGVFAEGDYALTEKLTLIAGGRFQHEKQSRYYSNYGSVNIDKDITDQFFLPKLGTTYAVSDKTTIGLSARKGYNSGGIGYDDGYRRGQGQVQAAETYDFDAETVYAYELSSKTSLDNGSTLNAALFYNNYNDYQAVADSRISNVDKAHTVGIELEATQWLSEDLEIRQSIGFMKSEIDENTNYQGNDLPNAPEWNASVGFTKYIGNSLTLGADVTYVGGYYSDLDNTADYKAGNHTLLDTNVDYEIGNLLISGYIKNLTDEDIIYVINGGSRAAVGQSRTVGLSATYRM